MVSVNAKTAYFTTLTKAPVKLVNKVAIPARPDKVVIHVLMDTSSNKTNARLVQVSA